MREFLKPNSAVNWQMKVTADRPSKIVNFSSLKKNSRQRKKKKTLNNGCSFFSATGSELSRDCINDQLSEWPTGKRGRSCNYDKCCFRVPQPELGCLMRFYTDEEKRERKKKVGQSVFRNDRGPQISQRPSSIFVSLSTFYRGCMKGARLLLAPSFIPRRIV